MKADMDNYLKNENLHFFKKISLSKELFGYILKNNLVYSLNLHMYWNKYLSLEITSNKLLNKDVSKFWSSYLFRIFLHGSIIQKKIHVTRKSLIKTK